MAYLEDSASIHSFKYKVVSKGTSYEGAAGCTYSMFVSFSVASGRDLVRGRGVCRVSRILELEGKVKDVYVSVFGQKHNGRYPNTITLFPDFVEYKETTPFKHESWMESESFLWVLANELMTVWPKDEDVELTDYASRFIRVLEKHAFSILILGDFRLGYFIALEEERKEVLHPQTCFSHTLASYAIHVFRHRSGPLGRSFRRIMDMKHITGFSSKPLSSWLIRRTQFYSRRG